MLYFQNITIFVYKVRILIITYKKKFIPERGEIKEENVLGWMRTDFKPRTEVETELKLNYQQR